MTKRGRNAQRMKMSRQDQEIENKKWERADRNASRKVRGDQGQKKRKDERVTQTPQTDKYGREQGQKG